MFGRRGALGLLVGLVSTKAGVGTAKLLSVGLWESLWLPSLLFVGVITFWLAGKACSDVDMASCPTAGLVGLLLLVFSAVPVGGVLLFCAILCPLPGPKSW